MMPDTIDDNEIEDWIEEDEGAPIEDQKGPLDIDSIGTKYASSQLRVVRETKDLSLDYLLTTTTYGKPIIDTSPSYQRRLRWTNKKRSLLIESLLLNIPIPPIFLYEKEYNEYEVVDGRQRVEAVISFLKNNYHLTGLRYWNELNGKRYNDLPPILKKGLLRRSISSIVLLAETTKPTEDVDIRTVLFERLNTGGEKLNPQELRNAIYQGSFNKLLFELSETKVFRKIWGIPDITQGSSEEIDPKFLENTLYKTMTDCELVLRYFAMKLIYFDVLKGSIKSVLDKCMLLYQRADDKQIIGFRKEYTAAMETLLGIFEDDTFILPKTRRISRPLYDGLMVAFTIGEGSELRSSPEIRQKLAVSLENREKYNILVAKANTIESIKERIDLAMEILYK